MFLLLLMALGCNREVWIEQQETIVQTYEIVDRTRITPAVQEQPESPQRRMELWVWSGAYTGYGSERPLLFMAHGGGGHPAKFDAFAREIASQGVVVAAVAFPLTNQYAPVDIVYGIADVANQPGDVTASLDWLLEALSDRKHDLYGQFSDVQLAYLGHSLGGQTGLASSRYSCCLEGRFQAWILAAPYTYLNDTLFPEHRSPPPATGPPTFLLHGQNDPVASIDQTQSLYEGFNPTKAFVGLSAATHSEYLESQEEPAIPSRALAQELSLAVLKDWVQGEEGYLQTTLEGVAEDGHEVVWDF
jgi:predicted esterase